MTSTEALAQLVQNGLFPEDTVGELLQVVEDVDARVRRGELTEEQADAVLEEHAARTVAARERAIGPLSADDCSTATAIALALSAPGGLS